MIGEVTVEGMMVDLNAKEEKERKGMRVERMLARDRNAMVHGIINEGKRKTRRGSETEMERGMG